MYLRTDFFIQPDLSLPASENLFHKLHFWNNRLKHALFSSLSIIAIFVPAWIYILNAALTLFCQHVMLFVKCSLIVCMENVFGRVIGRNAFRECNVFRGIKRVEYIYCFLLWCWIVMDKRKTCMKLNSTHTKSKLKHFIRAHPFHWNIKRIIFNVMRLL